MGRTAVGQKKQKQRLQITVVFSIIQTSNPNIQNDAKTGHSFPPFRNEAEPKRLELSDVKMESLLPERGMGRWFLLLLWRRQQQRQQQEQQQQQQQ